MKLWKDKPIDLLFCFDAAVVPFMGVAFTSLFSHKSKHAYKISCIIDKSVDKNMQIQLMQIVNQDNKSSIRFAYGSDRWGKNRDPRWATPAYFRFEVGEHFPDIEYAFYSDFDVVFTDSLDGLRELDMEPETVIMGPGFLYPHVAIWSGNIIMNVGLWNSQNWLDKTYQYFLDSVQDGIGKPDGDILNHFLTMDNLQLLPWKYSLFPLFLGGTIAECYQRFSDENFGIDMDDVYDAVKNPVVLHYPSTNKPWNTESFRHMDKKYIATWWEYALASAWAEKLSAKHLPALKKSGVKIPLFLRLESNIKFHINRLLRHMKFWE